MHGQRVVLQHRPEAQPQAGDFALEDFAIPQPAAGEMLLQTLHVSLDPHVGSALKGRHMSGRIGIGDTMPGETLSRIVQSRHPDFAEGDIVSCRSGWASHAIAAPMPDGLTNMDAALSHGARKLATDPRVPLPAYLGVLGMPGLTAYAGTTAVLKPLPGETFVVSSASGAVGSTAGQIAKAMGARVVGIAGGPEKSAHVVAHFGFAACIDRHAPDWIDRLAAACPDGVDAYYDSAGGSVLAGVMTKLAMNARIMLVGMMEQYNSPTMLPGHNLAPILGRRATVTGFVVYDHWSKLPRWRALGAGWIAEGRLRFKEDRVTGLAEAPAAFARLMSGQNFGKTIVDLH